MRKYILLLLALTVLFSPLLLAQGSKREDKRTRAIYALIDSYQQAREKRDTVLLKTILTEEVDQLVSSGEWRTGLGEAVRGMQQSSAGNPGTRTLTVERVRFLGSKNAIADARYTIANPDGSTRNMWSTFVVVYEKGMWKIAAIRNMLPAGPR